MLPYWGCCSSGNCTCGGHPCPYNYNMEGSSSSSSSVAAVDSNHNSSSPSLFHFPAAPFLEDEELFLTHFLSPEQQQHHHHQFSSPAAPLLPENNPESEPRLLRSADKKKKKTAVDPGAAATAPADHASRPLRKARSRSAGKKDRHSKICTAKGPRDRRMRLSLQIARRFFDLQDILGFDKASKTIDWLFSKSKSAIKDLVSTRPPPPPSPRLREIRAEENDNNHGDDDITAQKSSKGKSRGGAYYCEPVAVRESREKARARARERTMEKIMIRRNHPPVLLPNPNNPSGSRSPEFNAPDSAATNETTETVSAASIEHRMAAVGIFERFLALDTSAAADNAEFQGYAAALGTNNDSSDISFVTGMTTDSKNSRWYENYHHHNPY